MYNIFCVSSVSESYEIPVCNFLAIFLSEIFIAKFLFSKGLILSHHEYILCRKQLGNSVILIQIFVFKFSYPISALNFHIQLVVWHFCKPLEIIYNIRKTLIIIVKSCSYVAFKNSCRHSCSICSVFIIICL